MPYLFLLLNITTVCQWQGDSLGVGGVHHAQNELDDCAVELQTSAEQVLIQKTHVSTSFGSHQFLTAQSHMIRITSLKICSVTDVHVSAFRDSAGSSDAVD